MRRDEVIYVLYDDQCPFCRHYCRPEHHREVSARVELIDARHSSPLKDEITSKGLDLDRGMIVKTGDDIYYGAAALHILARLSHGTGFLNRFIYWPCRSKIVAFIIYPFLRWGRHLALWLMGIPMIKNLDKN